MTRKSTRQESASLDEKMRDYGKERTEEFGPQELYVVFASPKTRTSDSVVSKFSEAEHKRIFDEHIAHQVRLEESGRLFAAGPLLNEQGERLGGLIILRADSFEDAWRIVNSDPHRTSGLWDHEIQLWRLSEGSYTVTVKYSSKKAAIS